MLPWILAAALLAQIGEPPATGLEPNAPKDAAEPGASAGVDAPAEQPTKQPKLRDYDLPDPQRSMGAYLAAGILAPGVNLLYWAPSKYIVKNDYSDINFRTMKGNLQHGLVFDEDGFTTNQIGHPYQGGSYFNMSRSLGLSFWESAPYVALGSLTWEYLMESGPVCCYASANDFVTTTVGGIAVGEVLWRLSNAVLDDSTSGGERFARELAALAINPVYGLYRLTSGDAFTSGSGPLVSNHLWGDVTLGASVFGTNGNADTFATIGRLRMRRGHVLEIDDEFRAFDFFTFDLAAGVTDGEIVGARFDIMGVTNGWKSDFMGDGALLAGVGIDFDYRENVLANIGQAAAGPVLVAEMPLGGPWMLFTRFTLMAAYGAISSDYTEFRPYNLGFGASAKAWFELRYNEVADVYLKADRYWVHTSSGTPGDEHLTVLDAGTTIAVWKSLGLGFHVLYAHKNGQYDKVPHTQEDIVLGEAYVAWRY